MFLTLKHAYIPLIYLLGGVCLYAADFGQRDFYVEEGIAYSNASHEPLSGTVIYKYEKGQVQSRNPYASGLLQGVVVTFFEEGAKQQEVTFEDGRMHGVVRGWHLNGQLAFEGAYFEGKQHGLWRQWDNLGQLIDEKTYDARAKKKFTFRPPVPPS